MVLKFRNYFFIHVQSSFIDWSLFLFHEESETSFVDFDCKPINSSDPNAKISPLENTIVLKVQ